MFALACRGLSKAFGLTEASCLIHLPTRPWQFQIHLLLTYCECQAWAAFSVGVIRELYCRFRFWLLAS